MISTAIVLIGLLLLFLGAGLWIGPTMLLVAIIGMVLYTSAPTGMIMSTTIWSASTNWALTALPLFIWMGEILYRSRLSEDMFKGLAPWMSRIPGRLLHVNILGCAVFAAVCGSSAATALTVGKMSLPELKKRGYHDGLSLGTLCGSGTLGLMIPPSIMMIVYGVAAEVSIAQLFIAGVIPGLMLVVMFMGYVALWAVFNPGKMPSREHEPRLSFMQKIWESRGLIPVVILIIAVIGSIYTGVATATEAAAVGVAGSLLLSALSGSLTRANFVNGLVSAMVTSCMLTFILACAAFLSNAMGFIGLPRALASTIAAWELSPIVLLFALTIFYIVLGCFLDGISMVVLTTSIVMPLVAASGFDLVWFGIYIVIVCEMSQITPPVGFNLFALQSLTGRNILTIAHATLPFFIILALAIVLIVIFPEIALYLPQKMMGG
ncbi:TRAP transporter large permease subunit [Alcaligenaceae bacterium]|nr:TRAP transporter large permease subunit [Alcaligenaceae bacterium]